MVTTNKRHLLWCFALALSFVSVVSDNHLPASGKVSEFILSSGILALLMGGYSPWCWTMWLWWLRCW
ncbi:hypothetical protein HMPREF9134_00080 [Porphyromonas catoniae F0037]|uniref:Uncharacterized protein n=1 Tax=Porphyromonas catoniae F0037 TaxID=1127696 RepID=L1NIM9_9PORP|nr:hypothetical protein [Porphyromonas catoniae]EKY03191.1 hypothetical protein HMPREF9134_00080 [Porphyromonas catoniae F0037]